MTNTEMAAQMRSGKGFIAALDQSGGSTPKALAQYGLDEGAWSSDAEMFDLIHQMRHRIMASPAFDGDRVIGAILFEMTMDREVAGKPTARYLWENKRVVPFLKIDKGLMPEAEGVQLLKAMTGLDDLLGRAVANGIFGTKERSVIGAANRAGIRAIVAQQFEVGQQVLSHELMPILEPEVLIGISDKAAAEDMLLEALLRGLDDLPEGQQVMIKLSLPSTDDHYAPLVNHPRVMRVVALSGGHSRDQANILLARNPGVIASFSRALSEGLSAGQTDDAFNAALDAAIGSIHAASVAG